MIKLGHGSNGDPTENLLGSKNKVSSSKTILEGEAGYLLEKYLSKICALTPEPVPAVHCTDSVVFILFLRK